VKRVVAIYRSPIYSPAGHFENDTRILDETAAHLAERGLAIASCGEREVEAGTLPLADVYLNMCQGVAASQRLARIEEGGKCAFFNRPPSVLDCHRHRLVTLLSQAGLAFPATAMTATEDRRRASLLAALLREDAQLWVKRGDVHAERPEDVIAVRPDDLPRALAEFAARGVAEVAVQRHVHGPVVKFYGVARGRFFRWYDQEAGPSGPRPLADERSLRRLAFAAAAVLGLDIFGGDIALPHPSAPVLLDVNDWPSFAAFRDEAAAAIAGYVHERMITWDDKQKAG
jgi:hypothetical protein